MLNPKKWNVLCWVGLVLWLLPSSAGNIPYAPEISEPERIEMPGGGTAIAYDQTYLIGWPLTYLEVSKSPNIPSTKTYHFSLLGINLVLILTSLFGIVYSIQTFIPKFSLLTLLTVTTCIALLFPIGHLVFSTKNYYLQIGFMFSIYFAPLIAIIPAFVYARHKTRCDSTG